jgi:hypothetical protein
VLVGLHRVGVVGLRQALQALEQRGVEGRTEAVEFLLETLAEDNYVPRAMEGDYRDALWREVLRGRGRDFSAFYSPVEVTVRASEGSLRDEFVSRAESVLAELELRPVVSWAEPESPTAEPELWIGDQLVVRGLLARERFKGAVRKSLSDW